MQPFPGLNPYLEGYLFADLHSALASRIRALLTPLLRPRYAARLQVSVVQDAGPTEDLGIIYHDVEVVSTTAQNAGPTALSSNFTPATLTLPPPVQVRISTVEVREVKANRLITCIEILSYANKRQPGLDQYLQKRSRLLQAGGPLVEIDLIRRGSRPIADAQIPAAPYRMTITRANDRVAVWALQLPDALPTLPIPLLPPDPEVPLNLAHAIAQVYAEADYDLTIDYTRQPPPPLLSHEEQQWLQTVIA